MSIINCSKCNATRNTDCDPICPFCEKEAIKTPSPMRIVPNDPIPKTFAEVPNNLVVKLMHDPETSFFRCNNNVFMINKSGIDVYKDRLKILNGRLVVSIVGKIVYDGI